MRKSTYRKVVSRKTDKFNQVIDGCITYIELAKGARERLGKQGKLPQMLDFRLTVEINSYMNLLIRIAKVSPEYIMKIVSIIHSHEDKFQEEVNAFCKAITGEDPKALQLYNQQDMHKAIGGKKKQNVMNKELKTGSKIIMP